MTQAMWQLLGITTNMEDEARERDVASFVMSVEAEGKFSEFKVTLETPRKSSAELWMGALASARSFYYFKLTGQYPDGVQHFPNPSKKELN